jgi:hypothetical protein
VTDAQPFDTIGLGLPSGSVTVASYQFTDDAGVVSTRPFLVATEKGVQLLGGLISGMEGSGYWAGADLNEPNISTPPDDPARTGQIATDSNLGPRSLTLNPVDVTGKPKLKLTFALAGTEVDFDGRIVSDDLGISSRSSLGPRHSGHTCVSNARTFAARPAGVAAGIVVIRIHRRSISRSP